MKTFKCMLSVFLVLASLQSWGQFSLNTHIIPTFQQAGQAKLSFSYYHKPELHGAISLSDRLAYHVYWSHGDRYSRDQVIIGSNSEVIGEETYRTIQKLYLSGINNFYQLKKNRVFDLAIGLGYTSRKNSFLYRYTNGIPDSSRVYNNRNSSLLAYIQPSFSRRGKHVGWLVSFKATPSVGLNHNTNTVFLEPVFGLNFGGKAFRIDTQTGVRLQTNRNITSYRYFHWSIGLSYFIFQISSE
jgi:hypothetical protein